jgi:hypothetical protein
MTTPFHSPRDARAVLGTWSGSELLAIESALTDAHLDRVRLHQRAARVRARLADLVRATAGRGRAGRTAAA